MNFNTLKIFFYKLFFPSNVLITGSCSKCGSCCKNLLLMIYDDVIIDKATFENVQKTNAFYQNFEITGTTSDDELTFRCKLLIDNKCSIYKKRPFLCRNYPTAKMFKSGGSLHEKCTYVVKARKGFDFYLKNLS